MTAYPSTEIAPPPTYTAAPAPVSRAGSAWQSRAAVVLLLTHGLLAWIGRAFALETADEANYVLLSRALRHLRYVDLQLVGTPPHSHYPPAYPSFLALVSLVFGEHVDVFTAANVIASMLGLWMLYDVMKRRIGPQVALAALAVCALNPSVIYFAGRPLSETPYLLLSSVALWAILREPSADAGAAPQPNYWPVLAGAAAIVAGLTRTAGVTLLAAVFAYWVLERRIRRAATLAVVGAATVGGWLVWIAYAPKPGVGRSYIRDLSYAPGQTQPVGRVEMLIQRVTHNVLSYPTEALPALLPQPLVAGTKIDNLLGLFVILALTAAGIAVFWKRARIVLLYIAAYAGLLAVWPWNESRLVVPILPVILCLLVAGAFALAAMRKWLRVVPIAVVATVAITATVQSLSAARTAFACDRTHAATAESCFAVERRGLLAATQFIKQSTPPDAVILTMTDALTYYFSGRRTIYNDGISARDANEFESVVRGAGARYVLLSPMHPPDAMRVDWWEQQCSHLTLVAEFPGTTQLLALAPAGTTPLPNACADIQRYLNSPTNAELWAGRPGVPPVPPKS